jgi:hypothetical protein
MGLRSRELRIEKGSNGKYEVFSKDKFSPDWERPITFLVHGYNVEPGDAANSFVQLIEKIKESNPVLPLQLSNNCYLVCWRAYASNSFVSEKSFFSGITYPIQVTTAIEAAKALKRYIKRNIKRNINSDNSKLQAFRDVQINVIAHSLGCRLTLELISNFKKESSPVFQSVILMAAAVPLQYIGFNNPHHLSKRARTPQRTVAIYSKRDWILDIAFPIGQTLAGEGLFPVAVGRTGGPAHYWHYTKQTRNGHSDYFKDSDTGEEIVRAFGRSTSRFLSSRILEANEINHVGRVLPSRKPFG